MRWLSKAFVGMLAVASASVAAVSPASAITVVPVATTTLQVGSFIYEVTSCTYSVTATAKVSDTGGVVGATACVAGLNLQMTANGTSGVSFSSTGTSGQMAQVLSGIGQKGDITLTLQITPTGGVTFGGLAIGVTGSFTGGANYGLGVTGGALAAQLAASGTGGSTNGVIFTPTSGATTLTLDFSASDPFTTGTSNLTSSTVTGVIPEPASMSLIGMGILALGAVRRRRFI